MVADRTTITSNTNDSRKTVADGGIFLQDSAQFQKFAIDNGSTLLVGIIALGMTLFFFRGRKT